MQTVRLYEIPACKMVSSGVGMFGDGNFDRFMSWMDAQIRSIFPKDFLYYDCTDPEHPGFCWLYLYEPGMDVAQGLDIVDFPGGLYAVTTDIDQQTDMDALNAAVDAFLQEHSLVRDPSRPDLGNIITSPIAREILGYEQMDYYTPVKVK